jgi:biotin carboxyl carrier protein
MTIRITRIGPRTVAVAWSDGRRGVFSLGRNGERWATIGGVTHELALPRAAVAVARETAHASEPNVVTSPVTGRVTRVHVANGASVNPKDPLLTIESMKMELTLTAERAGRVENFAIVAGQAVARGAPLLTIA